MSIFSERVEHFRCNNPNCNSDEIVSPSIGFCKRCLDLLVGIDNHGGCWCSDELQYSSSYDGLCPRCARHKAIINS